jgi:hypothetical protein
MAAPTLCMPVRCIGWYTRSMSGSMASMAQASVRREKAGVDRGGVRTRFPAQAVAIPARAWPIGLGIEATSWQILQCLAWRGESAGSCKVLFLGYFKTLIHEIALDFRSARP